MVDSPVELLEYVTEEGKNPFREWLLSLQDREIRARVRVRLNRVRLGNFGDARSVGGGVSELRMPFGAGFRIYFGRQGAATVILLMGGDKRTQARDIKIARAYWIDYLRRTG